MSPILLGIFLAILGQIQAQSSPTGACSCPSPGSEPQENYGDDSYEYKKPYKNYGDEYYEYKKPHGKPEPQKGICASTGQSFASQCWLNLYNTVHGKDAAPVPGSQCHNEHCPICSNPDFYPGYNPICGIDRSSGNLTTLHNICVLECSELQHGITYDVLHCGTCETDCSEIEPKLDCLRPPRGCSLDPENPVGCDCDYNHFEIFLCAIDVKTKDLTTFFNLCLFNCAKLRNPNLQLLYGNGGGKCPCFEL